MQGLFPHIGCASPRFDHGEETVEAEQTPVCFLTERVTIP